MLENSNINTMNSYLDVIRQLETSSETIEYKYNILIENLFELSIGRDNIIFQNDIFMTVIFQSLPILHENIKKYLFSNDNMKEIKNILNQNSSNTNIDDDDENYVSFINKQFYTNYFNVKDHLAKFMSNETLLVLKDTQRSVYDNLCKCIEILLIGLLIYEYEKNCETEVATSKPFDENKSKFKTLYPEFFKGLCISINIIYMKLNKRCVYCA